MNHTVSDVFNLDTAIASPLVFVAGMVSAAGGVGGGIVFSSILQAISMNAHEAVPLALFMAFGISVGSSVFLVPRRHPFADRPLIDYKLALVLEAPTLAGSLFGVMVNVVFPEVLVFVFIVLFLATSLWRALASFMTEWKKEQALRHVHSSEEGMSQENFSFKSLQGVDEPDTETPESAKVFLDRDRRLPVFQIVALSFMWSVVTLLAIVRGGGSSSPSLFGVNCGSVLFYSLLAVSTLFLFGFLVASAIVVGREHKARVRALFPFAQGDVLWTTRRLILFPLSFFGIGLLAGLVGVGGGLIQGPLFMKMGVDPRVATSTTAFLVLFTTSSSVVQFFAFGKMQNWPLGIWYFGLGVIAALLGQLIISRLITHFRRPSFLCVALAMITCTSLVVLFCFHLPRIVSHFSFDFGSPCHPAGTSFNATTERAIFSTILIE